ncbi:hypothetical protein [Butyrivibrio sp. XBB1001]|uniref:hypothetical protein n=1 Tax=Butyrivibrio sp. XBB1001 TaxID=1280682 RepID=UPI00040328E9|nr:hypothetical protein [Butyrivibrio sp. XBB1001]
MSIFDVFRKKVAPRVNGYKTITTIEQTHNNPGGFSFEYLDTEVTIVKDDKGKRYLRVYKKECTAEGNGRPITTLNDDCYPLTNNEEVTPQNWKKVMLSHLSEAISLSYDSYSGV